MESHTHRGHCQVCGRVQAINTQSGLIAVHGYDLASGYIRGECSGSRHATLHVERVITDSIILAHAKHAEHLRALRQEYTAGTKHPIACFTNEYKRDDKGRRVQIMARWEDCTEQQQKAQIDRNVYSMGREADEFTRMSVDLLKWADKIHSKVEAYRVEDLTAREWKVGDSVRIGGKKGFTATIEAIETRAMKTFGFSRGRRAVDALHGQITQPAKPERKTREGYVLDAAKPAVTYWEPLRNIKRPDSALVAELKKAGKL